MTDAPEDLAGLRADLGRAFALMDAKAPGYALGREYYDGTRAEVFASRGVEAALRKAAKFAPISLAHIPVDVVADKVELASLIADSGGAEPLATVVDNNDLEDESDDWIRKACYLGDYYAITDPASEAADGTVLADDIKVVGSSPFTTIVIYDEKTGREAQYGVKAWSISGKRWRALLFYHNATVALITPPGMQNRKAEDFILDVPDGGEEADAYIEHVGGRLLIEHLAIDSKPYGTPLHRKAWGPQDAITKISATNLSNVDGQGFASRWALADPLAEIDDDIDDDFGTDGPATAGADKDGITAATSGTSRVRSIPGAISLLRGVKQVGQFDATDSDNFLKNLDWYVRVMAVACGVAMFEFDMKGEQPSGESRRRAEARSNKKAAKVKRQAGAFFEGIGKTVLALTGSTGVVAATFNPSETSTDKDGLELVSMKIKAGVPVRQALLEAGYTDDQVDEWYPTSSPKITPELLTVLAAALAQLGTAKTLGVITDAELADMLPDILTAPRRENDVPAVVPPIA